MGDKKRCSDCAYFVYDYFMDEEEEIDIFECQKGNNKLIGWGRCPCQDFRPRDGLNGTNY